jgi:hypothetical protein
MLYQEPQLYKFGWLGASARAHTTRHYASKGWRGSTVYPSIFKSIATKALLIEANLFPY